jgi:hypothetical protein
MLEHAFGPWSIKFEKQARLTDIHIITFHVIQTLVEKKTKMSYDKPVRSPGKGHLPLLVSIDRKGLSKMSKEFVCTLWCHYKIGATFRDIGFFRNLRAWHC